MTATYEKIATTTLGSAAADVTFSTISGSYTDLVFIITGGSSSAANLFMQFNSDTGSNYSATALSGSGSAAFSSRASSETYARLLDYGYLENNLKGVFIVNIQNYSNTTTYKSLLTRGNNTDNGTGTSVALWRNTSAITTVKIFPGSGNFLSGSTFTLYGIKAE